MTSNPAHEAPRSLVNQSALRSAQIQIERAGVQIAPTSNVPRPRVLLVYPIEASFVRTDFELLKTFCDVRPLQLQKPSHYPELVRGILECDIVFCWFALGFSAVAATIAKAVGRRSLIVAGGWDVVGFPEIGYGRLLTRQGRLAARTALSVADRVLAFSNWSQIRIEELAPQSHVQTLYLGVDTEKFHAENKQDVVVCIANVSRENLLRKGLASFVRTARMVPEARFVLAGKQWDDSMNDLREDAPENVSFTGWLSEPSLVDLLARARVYIQPSYTEGFGLALAEAMASGCVPVVTRAGALPEVVGDTGFYVESQAEGAMASAVRKALVSRNGNKARQRIVERFGIESRLRGLRHAIDELLGPGYLSRQTTLREVRRRRLRGMT